MTLLPYSLDLYCLIAVPDRALFPSQPIHTSPKLYAHTVLFYRDTRAGLIYLPTPKFARVAELGLRVH